MRASQRYERSPSTDKEKVWMLDWDRVKREGMIIDLSEVFSASLVPVTENLVNLTLMMVRYCGTAYCTFRPGHFIITQPKVQKALGLAQYHSGITALDIEQFLRYDGDRPLCSPFTKDWDERMFLASIYVEEGRVTFEGQDGPYYTFKDKMNQLEAARGFKEHLEDYKYPITEAEKYLVNVYFHMRRLLRAGKFRSDDMVSYLKRCREGNEESVDAVLEAIMEDEITPEILSKWRGIMPERHLWPHLFSIETNSIFLDEWSKPKGV